MRSPRLPLVLSLLLLLPAFAPLATLAGAAGTTQPLPPAAPSTPPAFVNYAAPPSLGPATGEPSIGINWETGNVMMSVTSRPPLNILPSQKFARVTFDDATTPATASWFDVSNGIHASGNIDPMLFTDAELGRTFAGGLDGACSIMAYSDDDGQSWTPMANPCASGPVGDHQSIASGPYAPPLDGVNPVWDHAVYYCSQGYPNGVVLCSRSDDGGITFHQGTHVPCGVLNPGLHGSVDVSPKGVVWVPFREGGGKVCVARSLDNGVTWAGFPIPGTSSPSNGFDPDVASTPGGWTYVGYQNGDGTAHVALTKDNGASWTVSPDLGAAFGLKVTTFHEMVAGDDQRAALAFLGTTTPGVADAFRSASFQGAWHLYVAYTYDGGMTWTTVKATTDPVQRGCIWDGGGENACRNLLDFMDADVDEVGRVVVGYADGCRGACAQSGGTPGQSRDAWATIARQSEGRGLFAAFDVNGNGPLTVAAGGPYAGFVGGAIALAGSVGGGTPPYAATWTVTSAPAGSAAAPANPNALSTTFTPDAAGAYALQLTVTDGASATQAATATLTATEVALGTCGTTGVLLSRDAAADGGAGGPATEVQCLRASDDASAFDLYIDLAGRTLTSTQATYDVYLTLDYAAGAKLLVQGSWNGQFASARIADPNTGANIVGRTATAAMEGSTFHIRTTRADLFGPQDGQKLTGVYLDAKTCVGGSCNVHADYAPDARDAQYVFGSSPTSGTVPLPKCGVRLAADASGDASGGNRGVRDLLALDASDDADAWTLCVTVRDWTDRPAGVGQVQVGWTADHDPAKSYYFVDVNVNADGTLAASNLYKGVAVGGLHVGPVPAQRAGNVLEVLVPKSMMGSPGDATTASGVSAATANDGGTTPDDATSAATFRFGQRLTDAAPPSQVTDLGVTDLRTGASLRLAWSPATDDTGVTSYVVKRAAQGGGPYAAIATPTGTTFTDAGLAAGETYWYVVAARDAAGNAGPDSAEVSGVPTPRDPDVTPPSVPAELVVSGTEADRVSITWLASADAESGVAGYRVWRDGALVAEVDGTTHTDDGLLPDTTYHYEVAAVNGDALESARAGILAATLPLPPPDCGQTGYQLFEDVDFDSQNGERRSDVVRASLHERDGRIWFHVGTRDASPAQSATRYRVTFTHAGTAYAVVGGVDDAGAFPLGVYRTVEIPGGGYAEPRVSEDVATTLACHSLVMGVRLADVGGPTDGALLSGLKVASTQDAAQNAAVHDRAPDAGTVDFVVGTSNLAPVLAAIGDRAVAEGETLAFTLQATDPNGDPLTFSATSLPAGATLDATTGAFSWTPDHGDAATYLGVAFTASDGKASDGETIAITVANVDTTPVLQPIGDRTVAEGETLAFTVLASDEDGDALTLAAANLPPGASFEAASGAFSWAVPHEAGHATRVAAGLRFEATDGRNVAAETLDVTVLDANRAPVLGPIGNREAAEGATLAFTVSASDADGDAVTVTAAGLPEGATFDGATFTWATTFGDAGNHAIAFAASDGALADEETVVLSVGDVNRPPAIAPLADQTVAEGATLALALAATDPDGAAVAWSSPNLPPGATLDAETGAFSWTPGYAQAGAYPNVQVVASDGEAQSTATFSVTVLDTDRAPVVAAIAKLAVDETATAQRNVAATDADGDAVVLTASGLPAWATFTDNGDGTGRVTASPPAYAEGTYPVTVRATSGALADERTFDLVVKRKVALTVARVGPATVPASPNQVLTFTATVTNGGTQTDTFDVLTGAPVGWTRGAVEPLTLAPGQSGTVAFTVTVPATGGGGAVTLTARSQALPTVARSASWTVTTPVTLRVAFAKATFAPGEEVSGVLTATWADGSPAKGHAVRVEQTPRLPQGLGASLASSVSGVTTAAGEYAFTFGSDAASRLPGTHDVRAWRAGAAQAVGAYDVG